MNLETLLYMVCVKEITQTPLYVQKVKKKEKYTRNCKAHMKLTKITKGYHT